METKSDIDLRLKELAEKLDCMTEADFQLLADITPSTCEAWRKRHQGPSYVRIGNRILYPRDEVAKHLANIKRVHAPARGLI